MSPLRTCIRLLAAVVMAFAVVACGDDDAADDAVGDATTTTTMAPSDREVDQEALDRVTGAVENTVDQGTATFTITVETQGTGTGGDGVQPIEADGEVDFEQEQRRIVLAGPQGDLDVVVDDEVAYLELPATEGEDWMRIELSSLFDEDLGMGGPAGIPFQDPEDNLRLLEASAVHAAEAGEETIDGTDTTRYEMVIDIEAASEEASDDVQEAIERTGERTDLQELDMDVWVDDEDLIRRVEYTLDLAQAEVSETDDEGSVEADPQGSVTVTVDYGDFGTSLDIQVPADEDVIDLDEAAVRDAISSATGTEGGSGTTTTSPSDTGTDDVTTSTTDGAADDATTSTTDGGADDATTSTTTTTP